MNSTMRRPPSFPTPGVLSGRYFEDFTVGDVYRSGVGRTISEADNTWFTLITMNTNSSHFDAHFAKGSDFGRIIVNSGLTVAILLGLTVPDLSQNAIANLGWKEIRLIHPVFVGDTLYAETQILHLRRSRSRPAGIVTAYSRGLNQNGLTCLSWTRSVMVRTRHSPTLDYFPKPKIPLEEDRETKSPTGPKEEEEDHPGGTTASEGSRSVSQASKRGRQP